MAQQIEQSGDRVVARRRVARCVRQLTQHDEHADAHQEARHHRIGNEAGEATEPKRAEQHKDRADQDGHQEQRTLALLPVEIAERLARGEGGGCRRAYDHELRARQRCPPDRADHRGVKPVQRVDADQDRIRHPVGNVSRGEAQSGNRIIA
jgi:hypothetical protein